MKEAESHQNKEDKIKIPFQRIDENKIKQLEARISGPSANGNMPVDFKPLFDFDVEQIKTSKYKIYNYFTIKGLSNRSDNTGNSIIEQFRDSSNSNRDIIIPESDGFTIKDPQSSSDINLGNNSNKSNQGMTSSRKKPPAKKAEKKIKNVGNLQIDFLTIKRTRNEDKNITNDESNQFEEKNVTYEENIEFSSKNIIAHNPLFVKKKENSKIMNNFINRGNDKINPNDNKNKSDSNNKSLSSPQIKLLPEKNYIQTSINIKNNNNSSQVNISSENNFKVLKNLQEENEKILKDLNLLKSELNDRDKKIRNILLENEDLSKNLTIMSKQFENQIQMSKIAMIKYLRELEEIKRSKQKKWLSEQEYKLGKAILQRVGNSVIEVWENGEEFIKLNQRIKEVELEKENLEKQKKNLHNFQKKRSNTSGNKNNNESSNEPSENDINDMRELINFKLNYYQKEEAEIREQLGKLEIDKVMLLIEKKRIKEEESSRFRGIQSKDKFPILAGRYLILSLLGKGGYSEVYRAYDLENNFEVACKIHQLNSQWSDNIKDNYIRHTIRENQIHKEIDNSKIVRHFDTIEIDISSFCTVLELCSGPDLHSHLKMHKQLPEKEARGIIIQILAGLEYLNKLNRKIIHYDLKPQNIIFHNMEVKISDFGLAKIVENNSDNIELTSQGVGTYWYLPPECFDTSRNPPGISSKVDIWSLGVILFELIYGIRPFGHTFSQDKILKEGVILNANKIDFPSKPTISKQCQDFIEKCLHRKQQDRLDVFEALEHEFIKPKRK